MHEQCGLEIPLSFLFRSPTLKNIIDFLLDKASDQAQPQLHPAMSDIENQQQILKLGKAVNFIAVGKASSVLQSRSLLINPYSLLTK